LSIEFYFVKICSTANCVDSR